MSSQIQITGETKVKSLTGVLVGTSGVVSSLNIDGSLGIPQLDVNGKILVSQLPNSVMEYLGTWDASTNTPTLVNGTGNQGDVYLCNVAGTVNFGAGPITFAVGDSAIYSGTIWQKAGGATGTVTSVGLTSTGNDAITITGSPITTSGNINLGFAGTNLQYINGAGDLTTFPSLTGYVPYTGATGDVDLGVFKLNAASMHIKGTVGNGHLGLKHQSASPTGSANESLIFADVNGDLGWLNDNLYLNKFVTSANTANRTYTFPNATGTVALTSDLSSYVPYTGATANVNLGTFDLSAYAVSADILEARLNGTASSPLILRTGTSGFAAGLNAISLISSPSIANTLSIISDVSSVTKTAQIGLGSLSATRTYTLPDATGTLALTSQIPTVSGTTNYLPKFTGASTIGNSAITDVSGIIKIGTTASTTYGTLNIVQQSVAAPSFVRGIQLVHPNGTGVTGGYLGISVSGQKQGQIQVGDDSNAGDLIINPAGGNLGLGVTPSAWYTGYTALQVGESAALFSNRTSADTRTTQLSNNAYLNSGATNWIYAQTDEATRYGQVGGEHQWFNAPSGTAGNAITFTQAMTLNASGQLGIGTATIGSKLQVNGNSAIGYSASTAAPTNGLAVSGAIYLNKTTGTAAGINATSLQVNNEIMATGSLGGFFMENRSGGVTSNSNWVGWYYSGTTLRLYNGAADVFSLIASTGATTFSSSVTADSFVNTSVRYIANQIQSGFNDNSDNSDIWINYSGYQGGTTWFRDFRIGNGKNGQIAMFKGSSGNVLIGTTTDAGYKLDVNGTGRFSGAAYLQRASSGASTILQFNNEVGAARAKILFGGTNEELALYAGSGGTANLTIASTGAATFSSGIATNGYTASTSYAALFNGNVGIGTGSPASERKLTVAGGAQFTGGDNTGAALNIIPASTGQGGADFNLSYYTGTGYGPLTFTLGGSERMRITSGGNIFFGTTGGINGNINYEFRASNSNGGVAILSAYNTSTFASSPSISCYKGSSDTSSANRFIQFYCNGESQPMGGIVGNGATNVQFASISDIREKENIVSIFGSLNKLLALNPVEFDWINTGEHIKAGFVAQQVEEIFPEYVVENMSNDGEEERKGLTGGMSSGIIAHLVKAIQEMNTKLDEQNQTIQNLQEQINILAK